MTTSPRLFECGSMAKPGDLEVEKETDASHALFVTGHAVEAFKATHLRRSEGHAEETEETVLLADVVRFTGRSRIELDRSGSCWSTRTAFGSESVRAQCIECSYMDGRGRVSGSLWGRVARVRRRRAAVPSEVGSATDYCRRPRAQFEHVPVISTVWVTSTKPCVCPVFVAQRST